MDSDGGSVRWDGNSPSPPTLPPAASRAVGGVRSGGSGGSEGREGGGGSRGIAASMTTSSGKPDPSSESRTKPKRGRRRGRRVRKPPPQRRRRDPRRPRKCRPAPSCAEAFPLSKDTCVESCIQESWVRIIPWLAEIEGALFRVVQSERKKTDLRLRAANCRCQDRPGQRRASDCAIIRNETSLSIQQQLPILEFSLLPLRISRIPHHPKPCEFQEMRDRNHFFPPRTESCSVSCEI